MKHFARILVYFGTLTQIYFACGLGANIIRADDSLQQPTALSPLYDVEPSPVHQWIAAQAVWKLPAGPLKDELKEYLPYDVNNNPSYYGMPFSPPIEWTTNVDAPGMVATALIEGVWEEDRGPTIPWLRTVTHFWNPDGQYNDGLDLSSYGYGVQPSALNVAQVWFGTAVRLYSTDKTKAYYWLGRSAHLLMDMAVPAHAQLDEHWFITNTDSYEKFVGSWEFQYKHITAGSPDIEIPDYTALPSFPRSTPSWFNNDLTKLFYGLANFTDGFDSDDNNGDSPLYGYGKYRRGSNSLDPDKTVNEVWETSFGAKHKKLDSPTDYFVVQCPWSVDASIIYSESVCNEMHNLFYGVRVYYTDGTDTTIFNIDEGVVPWAVAGQIFQPELESRAISYTAALYQLFWALTPHGLEDQYEPNNDCAHAYDLTADWGTWLHNVKGFGIKNDDDWYKISVLAGTDCLYLECYYGDPNVDTDIDLYDGSCQWLASGIGRPSGPITRNILCYSSPSPGTYYVKVYQRPYDGSQYDLWWGSDCLETIPLASPPDGYWFPSSFGQNIELEWSSSEKAEKYEIQIATNSSFDSPICELSLNPSHRSTPISDCSISIPDGSYYWRARVRNWCNTGPWSNPWSFTVGCPSMAIDPGTLTPQNGGSGSCHVTFDWPDVPNAAAYLLQIDTISSAFNMSTIFYNKPAYQSEMTVNIPPKLVYWRVCAIAPGACESGSWTSPFTYLDVDDGRVPDFPNRYVISQNYPNPFNPATVIEYSVPSRTQVTIEIFNVLGQKIRTLMNEMKSAGSYRIEWNGHDDAGQPVSTGICLYRIQAGEFAETKKMVLLK